MDPCQRLIAKRWCTMGELKTTLTRREVIDANEWLDAYEEADGEARRKAEEAANRRPRT